MLTWCQPGVLNQPQESGLVEAILPLGPVRGFQVLTEKYYYMEDERTERAGAGEEGRRWPITGHVLSFTLREYRANLQFPICTCHDPCPQISNDLKRLHGTLGGLLSDLQFQLSPFLLLPHTELHKIPLHCTAPSLHAGQSDPLNWDPSRICARTWPGKQSRGVIKETDLQSAASAGRQRPP